MCLEIRTGRSGTSSFSRKFLQSPILSNQLLTCDSLHNDAARSSHSTCMSERPSDSEKLTKNLKVKGCGNGNKCSILTGRNATNENNGPCILTEKSFEFPKKSYAKDNTPYPPRGLARRIFTNMILTGHQANLSPHTNAR